MESSLNGLFLWVHTCVGKLEFGLSNSGMEKVSLIACTGQFFSAMEIQSEPIKKNLLVSKSWNFLSYFKPGNWKFASNLWQKLQNLKLILKHLSLFLWEAEVVRYRWSMILCYKSKLWPQSSPYYLYFSESNIKT